VYSDCLLKCEGGELIPAHKIILAMASPFFNGIFRSQTPAANGTLMDQIIVLDGVKAEQIEVLLQYMYFGYAIVKCDKLPSISRVAKSLGIKEFPTLEVAPSESTKINSTNNNTAKKNCAAEVTSNRENLTRKRDSLEDFLVQFKKFKHSKDFDFNIRVGKKVEPTSPCGKTQGANLSKKCKSDGDTEVRNRTTTDTANSSFRSLVSVL